MSAKHYLSYRDQDWLENMLADIWYRHFEDVVQSNAVRIVYGRKAKRQLGSIRRDKNDPSASVITINPIFQDLEVPEYVIKATIVHEMTHYAHGFNSPLEQKHKHPHSGGVIRREFAERGLEQLFLDQKAWLKDNWPAMVTRHFPHDRYRVVRSTTNRAVPLPWWMRGVG
jgi:hypothetical protein